MKEVVTTWFVEPLDPQTNAAIAEFLTVTEIHDGVVCADGESHDLWDCDYRFISRLIGAAKRFGLKFRVFRRRGQGQIEEWRFAFNRKAKQPTGAS
ncbi:MAG: hypothetical protein UX89_C0029G0007 [Parcubacteria group bacterium GW2011_GWA2_47_16]|nr:MAG: hypothetical protein UX89_C0029G0007 [Parcubacteria group bacterium GW2011_GWA2_47_16]